MTRDSKLFVRKRHKGLSFARRYTKSEKRCARGFINELRAVYSLLPPFAPVFATPSRREGISISSLIIFLDTRARRARRKSAKPLIWFCLSLSLPLSPVENFNILFAVYIYIHIHKEGMRFCRPAAAAAEFFFLLLFP